MKQQQYTGFREANLNGVESAEDAERASKKVKRNRLKHLYEQYKTLSWKKKVLIGAGLTLASGVGFTIGGGAGGAILGISGVARAVTGGFAAYSTYTGIKGFAEQAPNPAHGILRRNLYRLLNKNPKLYATLVAIGSFALIGRSLSHWGEAGRELIHSVGEFDLEKAAKGAAAVVRKIKESLKDLLTPPTLESYIPSHVEEVSYAKIWDPKTPVLFVGETHTIIADKNELLGNLPLFKKLGMTHIAMEMFSQNQQHILDQYAAGRIPRAQVLECLKGWGNFQNGDAIIQKYMDITHECKKLGIKIIALDGGEGPPTASGGSLPATISQRDVNWARIVSRVIHQQPSARVLVYGGAGHMGYGDMRIQEQMVPGFEKDLDAGISANEALKKEGIASKVIDFAGGAHAHHLSGELSEVVGTVAQDLHLDQKYFAVAMQPSSTDTMHQLSPELRQADYIVHLPQTEEVTPQ